MSLCPSTIRTNDEIKLRIAALSRALMNPKNNQKLLSIGIGQQFSNHVIIHFRSNFNLFYTHTIVIYFTNCTILPTCVSF